MMCSDCKVAGNFNSLGQYDKAEEMHGYCEGDCVCQHKTGPGYVKRDGTKVPLMQTLSP